MTVSALRTAWLPPLLLLAGCGQETPEPAPTRPEWRGATIDGIAPLMTPQQVKAALDRRGYGQVACTDERPAKADPFAANGKAACFASPRRPMRLSLNFFELREGRRLAVVNFNEPYRPDVSDAERIAHGSALARQLHARLGKPLTVTRTPQFVTYYWRRPGGSPTLPDLLSTTVAGELGGTVTMTSFWAYGEVRRGG